MSEELKPCPFCGGTDLDRAGRGPMKCWVECLGCTSEGPFGETPAAAIAAWNRRAADDDPPVTRKELAYLLLSVMRLLEGNTQGGEDRMRVKHLWRCTYTLGRGEDARGEDER